MPLRDRALFLSLRPLYAEMILSGGKTVELRRIRPRAPTGTLVIVYASSPTCQVLGTCIVEDIGSGTPDEIWQLHGPQTGLHRASFRAYFAGTHLGVAITVSSPRRLPQPVSLEWLRRHIDGFAAPQSFRYLPISYAQALVGDDWQARDHETAPSSA